MHTDLPFFAGDGKEMPPWIGLHYIDPVTSEPMAGAEYEIRLDGGPTITGQLDEQGKARHDNVVDKPAEKVIYKTRPAKSDPLPHWISSSPDYPKEQPWHQYPRRK